MRASGADHRPRLTGGRARGRPLACAVPDGVRPTSARVREALFSLVGHDLSDVRVLDAYGGSGLLGFEAWSRGGRVTIVERDPAVVAVIRRNAQALGADVEIATGDVLRLVASLGPFDVVLVDPPYRVDPGPVLTALARGPAPKWVLEHDADVLPPDVAGLVHLRTRTYGGTALTVYDRSESA